MYDRFAPDDISAGQTGRFGRNVLCAALTKFDKDIYFSSCGRGLSLESVLRKRMSLANDGR